MKADIDEYGYDTVNNTNVNIMNQSLNTVTSLNPQKVIKSKMSEDQIPKANRINRNRIVNPKMLSSKDQIAHAN